MTRSSNNFVRLRNSLLPKINKFSRLLHLFPCSPAHGLRSSSCGESIEDTTTFSMNGESARGQIQFQEESGFWKKIRSANSAVTRSLLRPHKSYGRPRRP